VLLGHPRVFVGRRKHLAVSRAVQGTRLKADLDDAGVQRHPLAMGLQMARHAGLLYTSGSDGIRSQST
jgi:hypothetical protein